MFPLKSTGINEINYFLGDWYIKIAVFQVLLTENCMA